MLGWQAAYYLAKKIETKRFHRISLAIYGALGRAGESDNPRVQYALGNAQFRTGDPKAASCSVEKALELDSTNSAWTYRLGFIYERLKNWKEAEVQYTRATSMNPDNPEWHYRKAVVLGHLKRYADARSSLNNAIRINKTEPKYYNKLASLVRTSGELWQEIEILEIGRPFHLSDFKWHNRMGEANEKMNRFREAAEAFRRANTILPGNSKTLFREACCWEAAGDYAKAEELRREAIENDNQFDSKSLGIGIFFEKRELWMEAASAYQEQASKTATSNPELYYRLGLVLAQAYEWNSASQAFTKALSLNPGEATWHYKLGIALERQRRFHEASACYAMAIQKKNEDTPVYWTYRLGMALFHAGKFEAASQAFVEIPSKERSVDDFEPATEQDTASASLASALPQTLALQDADACFKLGDQAVHHDQLELAAECYAEGLKRQETHTPARYQDLGRVLAENGHFYDSCIAYSNYYVHQDAPIANPDKYARARDAKINMQYIESMKNQTVQDSIIMFESSHGSSASCNPLRISEFLLHDPHYSYMTHIWVINDKSRIPESLKGRQNVIFVARNSDLYIRYLAISKYLVNNNTFPPYFIRREDQQYLNTWHGTPIKTLGRDIKSGLMDHKNAARNFLHATHIIAPNEFTAKLLIEKYDVKGLVQAKLAITGYPRIDSTLNLDIEKMASIKRRLDIEDNETVVFYAPTWRGHLGTATTDSQRIVADLAKLEQTGVRVLFRGHAMTESMLSSENLGRFTVPSEIDTNDVLAVTDTLITDYSSVFFDFIPLARSIVLYAYDLDQYEKERGLYLQLDDMPAHVCSTIGEVVAVINAGTQSSRAHPEKQRASIEKFSPREDGLATNRAVEFFLGESHIDVLNFEDPPTGRNLLFYQGSFIPNGITSAYLSLTNELLKSGDRITVVVEPSAVASHPDRLEMFAKNPEDIRTIGRVGTQLVSAEERMIIDRFNAHNDLSNDEQWAIYHRAFHREYIRLFGSAKFDTNICFEGYARFWAALFSNSGGQSSSSVIYLHNDMVREWKSRFHYLEAMFNLYTKFDALISVTESVHELNENELSSAFDLPVERFNFSNNLIDPEDIIRKSLEPLDSDIRSWIRPENRLFVTVGRLSPEKGHSKLLRAFRLAVLDNPGIQLLIIGDGPLRTDLAAEILDLDLSDSVLLGGLRLNPFSAMAAAECFLFSSDYEGQGLVVLEALVLGLPVISTDVVGPRSILSDGSGWLVDNSVEGLASALKQYLAGEYNCKEFDPNVYQAAAFEQFNRILELI